MASSAPRSPPGLTFTFKNLGPIDSAELELGDLTIIAGRNNTGKTYLVYALYGFLKTWKEWLESPPRFRSGRAHSSSSSLASGQYPTFEQIYEQVAENGHAEYSVDSATLSQERTAAMDALTRRFSEGGFAQVFSSSSEEFKGAFVCVKLGAAFPRVSQASEVSADRDDRPSIRYDGTDIFVIGTPPGKRRTNELWQRLQRGALWRRYLRFLFQDLLSEPFVLSAERFGISLFYRELDFQKGAALLRRRRTGASGASGASGSGTRKRCLSPSKAWGGRGGC